MSRTLDSSGSTKFGWAEYVARGGRGPSPTRIASGHTSRSKMRPPVPEDHGRVQRQLRIFLPGLGNKPHRTLTKLRRILPRCWHDHQPLGESVPPPDPGRFRPLTRRAGRSRPRAQCNTQVSTECGERRETDRTRPSSCDSRADLVRRHRILKSLGRARDSSSGDESPGNETGTFEALCELRRARMPKSPTPVRLGGASMGHTIKCRFTFRCGKT